MERRRRLTPQVAWDLVLAVLAALVLWSAGVLTRAAGLVVAGAIAWLFLRSLNRAMGFPWPWRALF